MKQDLAHSIAAYYVRSYTKEQINNFLINSDDVADKQALQIAINILYDKYGKQMELNFVGK